MNYPTIKTLTRIHGLSRQQATEIRAILATLTREQITERYTAAGDYDRACYHRPPMYLLKLYACNQVMEAYGVEAIDIPEGSFANCQDPKILIEYVNLGDTYTTTLCRVVRNGRTSYRVIDWGTLVERYGS